MKPLYRIINEDGEIIESTLNECINRVALYGECRVWTSQIGSEYADIYFDFSE